LPKNGLVCNATADKQLALRIRGKWWLQIVSINLDILYLAKQEIQMKVHHKFIFTKTPNSFDETLVTGFFLRFHLFPSICNQLCADLFGGGHERVDTDITRSWKTKQNKKICFLSKILYWWKWTFVKQFNLVWEVYHLGMLYICKLQWPIEPL
jgi:hypothetical protein